METLWAGKILTPKRPIAFMSYWLGLHQTALWGHRQETCGQTTPLRRWNNWRFVSDGNRSEDCSWIDYLNPGRLSSVNLKTAHVAAIFTVGVVDRIRSDRQGAVASSPSFYLNHARSSYLARRVTQRAKVRSVQLIQCAFFSFRSPENILFFCFNTFASKFKSVTHICQGFAC